MAELSPFLGLLSNGPGLGLLVVHPGCKAKIPMEIEIKISYGNPEA
jgi:hypothetical protein